MHNLRELDTIALIGDLGEPPPERLEVLYKTMLQANHLFGRAGRPRFRLPPRQGVSSSAAPCHSGYSTPILSRRRRSVCFHAGDVGKTDRRFPGGFAGHRPAGDIDAARFFGVWLHADVVAGVVRGQRAAWSALRLSQIKRDNAMILCYHRFYIVGTVFSSVQRIERGRGSRVGKRKENGNGV